MFSWINRNKKWVFSGIGIPIFSSVWIIYKKWNQIFSIIKLIGTKLSSQISINLYTWQIILFGIINLGILVFFLYNLVKRCYSHKVKKGIKWVESTTSDQFNDIYYILFWFPVNNTLKTSDTTQEKAFLFEKTPLFKDLIEHEVFKKNSLNNYSYAYEVNREVYNYYKNWLNEIDPDEKEIVIEICKNNDLDTIFENIPSNF